MEEAFELESYLPLSYKSEAERDYIAFLWDAFRTNYEHGKYQFAFLAYHMLTMSCVYFNIWQIKLALPELFKNALIGFDRDTEKELLESTSPFMFWRVKESTVMRFLKLLGCDDDYVSRCTSLVKERNDSAHANGNIYYNDAKIIDKKISEVLGVIRDIEVHSKLLIEQRYAAFLKDSQDPEDRDYEDDTDQIREVLIFANYFSQKDVDVCVLANVRSLANESGFTNILRLHRCVRNEFSELESIVTMGRSGRKVKLSGREWERMVAFLAGSGWQPSMPTELFFVHDTVVTQTDASSLANAVQTALPQLRGNAVPANQKIPFDINRLSEIGSMASEGNFTVWVAIKSPAGPV